MKRLFTLIALACVVGSINLLAQTTETIDFRGFNTSWGNPASSLVWDGNYITGISQDGTAGRTFSDDAPTITISVANTGAWQIGHDGDHDQVSFLQKNTATGTKASVYIHNLQMGDKVRIWFVDNENGGIVKGNITNLTSGSQINDGQIITVYSSGTLEFELDKQYSGIRLIQITKSNIQQQEETGSYSYDPAIEIYDLYWVARGATYTREPAGFPLDYDDWEALLITNLSDGTPINRRLVISEVAWNNGYIPWSFINNDNGTSEGLRSVGNWHNFSINNLVAGDRVRLIFHNNDFDSEGNEGYAKIASKEPITGETPEAATFAYTGSAAFQDTNNNGVQDEGEPSIEAGMNLAGANNVNNDYETYFYTVTEDGHLDFALYDNVRLCKIEIYADHQAAMVHEYNGSPTTGYTAYFNTTGQLEAKSHVIPGGLQVQIGNEDESQHALVVASPISPVAFATNERHRKFAINSENEFNTNNSLQNTLPTTGTFHKFTPEVGGNMTIRFYTSSINYLWPEQDGNYRDASGTTNENPVNVSCPYYLIDVDANGNKSIIRNESIATNSLVSWNVSNAQVGHTYYLYGGWSNNATASNYTEWESQKHSRYGCGVPKLLDVTFIAEKIVYPLAKWVENASTADDNLAYVKGYSYVKVKKMSGNIVSCEPYLDGTTLKIRNIQYATGDVNKGGVVLIEITDDLNSYNRADPVFAFTVAYDASYHSTSTTPEEQRGHTWDFSTKPLDGLKWNTYSNYADVTPFGTYFQDFYGGNTVAPNTTSLLYDEMNWTDSHGIENSDWTFNYRLKAQGNNYDPQFLNNYDMVGDNADMMWDSEGMVIVAGTNHSSIFNEFGQTVAHTETTDPDRYIGMWPGDSEHPSEFIIPRLDKDDRVIIWMGSGTGPESETKEMVFNITNARDAEYKEISATDNYVAGGSHWDGATGDSYYRGCYHFFAKDHGDMVFKLVGGSMCKIYKIQIYHGDRINTNEIKGATNDDKFLLTSTDVDPNDANSTSSVSGTYNWTLQYFGKDQKIADGSNSVSNSVVARSGVGIPHAGDALTTSTETDPTAATYNTFTYQHALGQIGTFRMRGKDMEKNMKYVADYGEHNVTVAYQQTMEYPYTWDFKDVTGWGNNRQNFSNEDAIGSFMVSRPDYFDSDNDWDASYEKSSKDLSLWELDVQDNTTYYLRLNSQSGQTTANLKVKDNIFETAKAIDGNQYWANGFIVPETQGLWFYSYDNNRTYNTWGLTNDGLAFNGQNKSILNMVVPNVPAGAAVYLRLETNGDFSDQAYLFKGGNTNCEVYGPVLVDGTINEYIYAIKNKGAKRHLTFSISGYQLKKIAVSTDPKAIGKTGYATESRARDIDHYLTSYLTGKPIKAYTATISDGYEKVVLSQVGAADNGVKILPAAENGDTNGCILYHDGGTANSDGTTNRTVSILDGGFHVFVPDMHDKDNTSLKATTTSNAMKSFNPVNDLYNVSAMTTGYLSAKDGDNTNLILTSKKYNVKDGASSVPNLDESGYEVFFVRVDPNGNSGSGATLKKCSAYIQIPTKDMVKLSTPNNDGSAKMSIVFDDWFGEINNGIATGIDQVTSNKSQVTSAEWYNLNGQKLNGMPTEKGLYIVNGRKVLVK